MSQTGVPAAPRAAGRGGARERVQFSPQAETEPSGLCDDAMGGAPLWEQPLAGASTPGGRRPAAHITLAPPVTAAQQIVRGDAEVVRQLDEVRDLRIICG